MKIPYKKSKIKIIVSFILLTIFICTIFFYYFHANSRTENQSAPETSYPYNTDISGKGSRENPNVEKQATDDKKKFLDNEKKEKKAPTKVNKSDEPNINISAKSKAGNLLITTNLATLASGTCTLVLKNNESTITRKAAIIYTPDYSSCAGFSIPLAELEKGTWTISLTANTPTFSLTKTIKYEI